MKYCVFTVVMGEYRIEDVPRELRSLGYDGIEWRVHDDWHVSVAEIREKAAQIRVLTEAQGLDIPALGAYLSPDDLEQVEIVFRAAKAMNCPSVRVAPTPYDGKTPYDQVLKEATDSLEQVQRVSREASVKALIETHFGTIMPSASAAYRLVSQFDPQHVGVIFDPANMVLEGRENWRMGIEILGEHLAHVHVKNVAWFRREHGVRAGWEWEYAPLGSGMVDWGEVMTVLKAVGYDGYLSVEDLYGTHLCTTGLTDERLSTPDAEVLPTLERLGKDLAYLRSLEAG